MLAITRKFFICIILNLVFVNAAVDVQDYDPLLTLSAKKPVMYQKKFRDTTTGHGELDRAVISVPFYGIIAYQLLDAYSKLSTAQLGGGLFAGWLIADYVSGAVHAIDDILVYRTFTNKAVPIERLIRKNDNIGDKPFLDFPEKDDEDDHHKYPTMFTKKSYWYTARIYHLIASPMLGAIILLSDPLTKYILLTVTVFGANNHLFHSVGHGAYKGNPAVAVAQKCGLLLGTKHHAKHHQGDHERNFCIISGWMDCLLNPTIHYVIKPTVSALFSTAGFFRKWCGQRENVVAEHED